MGDASFGRPSNSLRRAAPCSSGSNLSTPPISVTGFSAAFPSNSGFFSKQVSAVDLCLCHRLRNRKAPPIISTMITHPTPITAFVPVGKPLGAGFRVPNGVIEFVVALMWE